MLIARRYDLGHPLGRGGMGQVWRGFDQVLGREVAVKLLHPGLNTEPVAARFRLEARSAARISNPHVVAVYDFGVDDDQLFLVMELVDGRSLAADLRRTGPVSSERAANLLRQAAEGLASAHTHGVVHRDVKPSNLLLGAGPSGDRDDRVLKIADFGIARITDDSGAPLTAAGEVTGTSQYLAPERALGEPGGPPADIYSLGCVGYHLLTGRPPFEGDAPAAIAFQHVHHAPAPPHETSSDIDAAVESLVLRMLAKDPDQRPTPHEIAELLASGTSSEPFVLAPLVLAPMLADESEVAEHVDTEAPTAPENAGPGGSSPGDRRTGRAMTRPLLAAATVALVAGSAVVWATTRTGVNADDPPADSPASFLPGSQSLPARLPTPGSTNSPSTGRPASADPTVVNATNGDTFGPTTGPTPGATSDPSASTTTGPATSTSAPPVPPTATGPTTPASPGTTAPSSPPTTGGPTQPATTPPATSTSPTALPTKTPKPKPPKPPKPTHKP